MSILQEYEKIKRNIGKEKWDSIETYINNHHPELTLDRIIYNADNWIDFEKWFYSEMKLIGVNVLSTWKSDYDDFRALAEIKKGNNDLGKIIASYDENTIRNLTGNIKNSLSDTELKNAFAVLISSSFDYYSELPKISNCSKLLQSIYDDVCQSDATMCHITEEDWEEYYIDNYSIEDIKILEEEIKKYKLEEVVCLDEGEYKIIGYGDLETRFIDDRTINHEYVEEPYYDTVTDLKDLNDTGSFTVARVVKNDKCVELHYRDGKAFIEYGVKVDETTWENEIEYVDWFRPDMKENDISDKLWNLYDDYFGMEESYEM